jgi:putative addiction module component (TIGR02574 family)
LLTKTAMQERSGLPHPPARPQIDTMAQPAVDLDALRKLSVAERIQLVADLWDSIALEAPDDAFPMSPALAAELDRRMAELDEERVQPLSWEEVRKQILHGTLGKP